MSDMGLFGAATHAYAMKHISKTSGTGSSEFSSLANQPPRWLEYKCLPLEIHTPSFIAWLNSQARCFAASLEERIDANASVACQWSFYIRENDNSKYATTPCY